MIKNNDLTALTLILTASTINMPAHPRGLAPDPNAWRNDARYCAPGGPGQVQPPTGPSRGMHSQYQPPAGPSYQISAPVSVSASVPVTGTSSTPRIPDPPAIPTFSHVAYFTAIQLEILYARKRGARMSASTWKANRDAAVGFIQAVASRLGFPQRTIATAQQIYQRFHLFYPPSEFSLREIALASLFVAAKLNDTHKKPRDILLASYALRFPDLVKGNFSGRDTAGPLSTRADNNVAHDPTISALAGQKRKNAPDVTTGSSSPKPLAMAIGSVAEADIDPNLVEYDRKRLMAHEKLILESLCFNFHSSANITLKMVIKLARRSKLSKSFTRSAWKIAADMFRTSAPMQYPPNVIAVAALYAVALLARPPPRSFLNEQQQGNRDAASSSKDADPIVNFLHSIKSVSATPTAEEASLSTRTPAPVPLSEPFPGCDSECHVLVEDVEESVHELLDLYLGSTAQLPSSLYDDTASTTSSPLSPSDHLESFNIIPSSPADLGDPSGRPPRKVRRPQQQYEYSPPPFGLVDWLNSARFLALQAQLHAVKSSDKTAESSKSTAPVKELSALLTDLKIYLRGIEYDRQKADDAYLAELGILAEVNVYPLPEAEAAEAAAAVGAVGMLNTPAHSVSIKLAPLNETQAGNVEQASRGTSAPAPTAEDPTAKLTKEQKKIVERIRRRKLVSALRLTFVEPGVEKRFNMSAEAVQKREHQKLQQVKEQQAATATVAGRGETVVVSKRNRIEAAKRYLF